MQLIQLLCTSVRFVGDDESKHISLTETTDRLHDLDAMSNKNFSTHIAGNVFDYSIINEIVSSVAVPGEIRCSCECSVCVCVPF